MFFISLLLFFDHIQWCSRVSPDYALRNQSWQAESRYQKFIDPLATGSCGLSQWGGRRRPLYWTGVQGYETRIAGQAFKARPGSWVFGGSGGRTVRLSLMHKTLARLATGLAEPRYLKFAILFATGSCGLSGQGSSWTGPLYWMNPSARIWDPQARAGLQGKAWQLGLWWVGVRAFALPNA